MNFQLVRDEFSYLDDVIYLNVASLGMPPMRSRQVYSNFVNDYCERYGVHQVGKAYAEVDQARGLIAQLIHCLPQEIFWVPNTCQGITALTEGYPWSPGDNIITGDLEHASGGYPCKYLTRKGVEVRSIKSEHGAYTLEAIDRLIDRNTKILCISASPWETGYYADLKAIGHLCHAKGVLFAVDAMQVMGRMSINVADMEIDYLTSGSHKGMLGTFGSGFAYCASSLIPMLAPIAVSKQGLKEQYPVDLLDCPDGSFSFFPDARKFEAGNLNYSGILMMAESVKLFLQLGPENIQRHILGLETELRNKVLSVKNLQIGCTDEPARFGGNIYVFPHKPFDQEKISALLKCHHVIATEKQNYLRFSIGIHNTSAQMDTLSHIIQEIDTMI